jgi:hypothetical protein
VGTSCFVLAAAASGFLAERGWDRQFSSSIGAMLTGNVIIYLVGLPWLAVVLDRTSRRPSSTGSVRAGHIFKLYLAAAILPTGGGCVSRSAATPAREVRNHGRATEPAARRPSIAEHGTRDARRLRRDVAPGEAHCASRDTLIRLMRKS